MTKYQDGDIVCTTIQRPDGRFQGKVVVRRSVLHAREAHVYLCPDITDTKEEGMREAMNYVRANYPPE